MKNPFKRKASKPYDPRDPMSHPPSGRVINLPRGMEPFIKQIWNGGGEYDSTLIPRISQPRIADVGAHWGGFTAWALSRFPGCTIDAYEPHPDNAAGFLSNFPNDPSVRFHPLAVVTTREPVVPLFLSNQNSGSHSTCDALAGSASNIGVRTIHAGDLPDVDILKLDCEGPELDIIKAYFETHPCGPEVIMLEWHPNTTAAQYEELLSPDYLCAKKVLYHPLQGVMVWVLKGAANTQGDHGAQSK
jgi:FkbM family methyltransferase